MNNNSDEISRIFGILNFVGNKKIMEFSSSSGRGQSQIKAPVLGITLENNIEDIYSLHFRQSPVTCHKP